MYFSACSTFGLQVELCLINHKAGYGPVNQAAISLASACVAFLCPALSISCNVSTFGAPASWLSLFGRATRGESIYLFILFFCECAEQYADS